MKIHLIIIICVISIGNAFSQKYFDEWVLTVAVGSNFPSTLSRDINVVGNPYQNQQMSNLKFAHMNMKGGKFAGVFDFKYIEIRNSKDSILTSIDYFSTFPFGIWAPILKGRATLIKVDAKVHLLGVRQIKKDEYIYEPGIELSFSFNTEYAGIELSYFKTILLENSNRVNRMESIHGVFLNYYIGLSEPVKVAHPKPTPKPSPKPIPTPKPSPKPIPVPLPYSTT